MKIVSDENYGSGEEMRIELVPNIGAVVLKKTKTGTNGSAADYETTALGLYKGNVDAPNPTYKFNMVRVNEIPRDVSARQVICSRLKRRGYSIVTFE